MKYVLDTNAVSALMRGDTAVIAALKGKDKQDVAIPQPVMAEIAYGIERLPRSRRKDRLRERFATIRDEMTRVPWDDEVSDRFGAVPRHAQPVPRLPGGAGALPRPHHRARRGRPSTNRQECGLTDIEIRYTDRGTIPLTAWHWPSAAGARGRWFSNNVVMVARRP